MLVSDLEDKISRKEFAEWQAYETIELERHEKIDYYFAQAAMCSMLPHLKKGTGSKIGDYLIKFGSGAKKKIKMSGQDMKAIFQKLYGEGSK